MKGMKKHIIGLQVILLFLYMVFPFETCAQEDEVATIETVRVVNIEVPVRVLLKGKPVDHLKRSQFKIFEDGKPQEINGFYIKRKKISSTLSQTEVKEQRPKPDSRYFFLVFKITTYNDELQKGLDYLFKNVFRKSDQCMVFINNKTLFFKNLSNMKDAQVRLDKMLLAESHHARQRLVRYLKKIEDELNTTRLQALMDIRDYHSGDEIIRFLQKYILIWEDYSRNYLRPDIDKYYYFSRYLQKIKKEKWLINFYQIEMFPKLKPTGRIMEDIRNLVGVLQSSDRSEDNTYAKTISSLFKDIDQSLHTTKNFPAEEISKLFYKVDTTFHSILTYTNREMLSQDLEYKRISTEIESSLREITKRTGGSLHATGNLESALNKIKDDEDIIYMLTYSPVNPEHIGKIKVEVENNDYTLLYDDQMRADYISEYLKKKKLETSDIQIRNIKFEKKILSLEVAEFLMAKQKSKVQKGHIYIEIQIKDINNKTLYDQNKSMIAEKNPFFISINFSWLKKGRYKVSIQVLDILTGKSSLDFIQTSVN